MPGWGVVAKLPPVEAQAPASRLEEGSGEGSSPRRAAHYHAVLACRLTAEHRRGDQDGAYHRAV